MEGLGVFIYCILFFESIALLQVNCLLCRFLDVFFCPFRMLICEHVSDSEEPLPLTNVVYVQNPTTFKFPKI